MRKRTNTQIVRWLDLVLHRCVSILTVAGRGMWSGVRIVIRFSLPAEEKRCIRPRTKKCVTRTNLVALAGWAALKPVFWPLWFVTWESVLYHIGTFDSDLIAPRKLTVNETSDQKM